MGTTTNFGLTFPDRGEPMRLGRAHLQSNAETADAALQAVWDYVRQPGLTIPEFQQLLASPDSTINQLLRQTYLTEDEMPAAVAAALADSGVPAAAAAAAVTDALNTNPRIPEADKPDTFRVRNLDGGVPFEVTANDVHLAATVVEPSTGFTVTSTNRARILDVDPVSGEVYIPNLKADRINGATPGGGLSTGRVVLLAMLGQSNAEGRGRPYGPELDPADSRLLMWNWPTAALAPATVPLSSQQQQTGLSVATTIARRIVTDDPAATVVIVNAGVGSSGLVAEISAGVWRVDYTGTNPALYPPALAAIRAAVTATAARFGATPEVRAFWHQGEADAATPAATYTAALDALVARLRADLNLPDLTFTLGGMVPEFMAGNTGRLAIRGAHVDTPRRLVRTGYADGIPNAGGSGDVTDLVHYAREGVERLGAAMHTAWRRAVVNTATSVPMRPPSVTATKDGAALTISWTPPLCRVTGYLVETSTDGGAWTTVPTGTSLELTVTATITPGARVAVRVSTVNPVGTSTPTTPVYATPGA